MHCERYTAGLSETQQEKKERVLANFGQFGQ